MQGLKGVTWNSEGFRDSAKHLFVQETIREHRLDFIALLEIGRSNFTVRFLNHLAPCADFAWFCLPPHGRSGGILVGVNTSTLQFNILRWREEKSNDNFNPRWPFVFNSMIENFDLREIVL
jgi:hypothetical protein